MQWQWTKLSAENSGCNFKIEGNVSGVDDATGHRAGRLTVTAGELRLRGTRLSQNFIFLLFFWLYTCSAEFNWISRFIWSILDCRHWNLWLGEILKRYHNSSIMNIDNTLCIVVQDIAIKMVYKFDWLEMRESFKF